MQYGKLPDDLGLVDLSPVEMMFWMYCPIKLPGDVHATLPDNLWQFDPLVEAVRMSLYADVSGYQEQWTDRYAYLTAKTLYLSPNKNMNRPGWHSDGFGTDDLNFIWSDRAPTEFIDGSIFRDGGFTLPEDCTASMEVMKNAGMFARWYGGIVTYPDRHLLRLDPRVIHRAAEDIEPGMRTFLKVSLSRDRYDLVGNARNHRLPGSRWDLVERRSERNHPASVHA